MARRIITEEEALEWKRQYEENPEVTIESLALDNYTSLVTMRRWLNRVNTKMRPPSGRHSRNKDTDGIKRKSDSAVRKPGEGSRYHRSGHRRRGRGFLMGYIRRNVIHLTQAQLYALADSMGDCGKYSEIEIEEVHEDHDSGTHTKSIFGTFKRHTDQVARTGRLYPQVYRNEYLNK